ncbi:MAG TPA: hypothetical protein VLA52_15600 [Thermohalobaculum sp.]|nr:hypothetical protein [Thermohalobaculum sp.]
MKNAAMVLGIIGGVVGMVVGFFGYGWTEVAGWFSSVSDGLSDKVIDNDNPDRVRFVSLFAPILSIAGGAMSPGRPLIGAVLMLLSAAGMHWGFGFNVFTMFPIGMCLVAGLLGLGGALGRER